MRIIITGMTGFVGRNLSSYLQSNFLISGISEKSTSDELSYASFFKQKIPFDVLIHLAGIANDFKRHFTPNDYYKVNTEHTIKVFNAFLASDAKLFITLSSVKAVVDGVEGELTEQHHANPITHYGKSKLLAEQFILSNDLPQGKRVFILRPCMIHGPGNKGNLNLLYKLVSKGIPWPLGAFENKRSFCSIDNLMFIIKELIEREEIPSGIYNVSDDDPLSTNELIGLIANSQNRQPIIWKISRSLIERVAKIGHKLHLPLNLERLYKLTSSYVVSNEKIKAAIGKPFPVTSRDGLLRTFKSFNNQ